MAGITNFFTSVPRIRTIRTNKIFPSVGGANPVDAGAQQLPNIRGQLTITGTSSNGYSWGLQITGGFGEFPDSPTQDFYFAVGTNMNCTVTTLQKNRIRVETEAADAGGRVYILQFYPFTAVPATIRQISVNVLAAEDLSVLIERPSLLPGF